AQEAAEGILPCSTEEASECNLSNWFKRRQLGTGQEHLVRRADAQDHALQQMRNEDVDEMQIVVGGWNECKRELIEEDVRQMFACMDGGALIRNIYIPYVRCGYCRVELNYPEQDIWKQRKLQGVVVQALKEQRFASKAPGQENCSFWAARNRSIQERAKVRAVISTYELCVRHVGATVADRDWRGRVWVGTTQVLHHIEHRTRRGDTLMLIDARGNETGWYLDLAQMQASSEMSGTWVKAALKWIQCTAILVALDLEFVHKRDAPETWERGVSHLMFHLTGDLRVALPSDHNAVCMKVRFRFRRTVPRKLSALRELVRDLLLSGAQTEGSYIQRCGGVEQATTQLFQFYDDKYSTCEAPVSDQHWDSLAQRHAGASVAPVTKEEVLKALKGARNGVSAGMDGVTYEGVIHLINQDQQSRIPAFFTALMRGEAPLPLTWKQGKIVLLPKAAPPYTGHQIGCRPGVQAADGIMAAQAALQLLKQITGRSYAVKIDIKAAFDSISQLAVFRWLMTCRPAKECELLFQLLHGTSVELGLGGHRHVVPMHRGLMQGTAYSADVFSRVIDYFLGPLHDRFSEQFSSDQTKLAAIPHFIIYADDIILFADSPASLQSKLQQVIDVLATLGLQVNPDKSCAMTAHDGSSPGIWLRGRATPLQVDTSLVFLGVPLSHSPSPQLTISHLLRKTNHAYYGFKRIMDCGQAPLSVRLLIFETFITAKWAWAAAVGAAHAGPEVRASWTTDLLVRTVSSGPIMLGFWVSHWVPDDAVPTFDYLLQKQDFTEVPYSTPLHTIKPAKLSMPFIWGKADQGRCAVLLTNGVNAGRGTVVHSLAPEPTVVAMSVTLLRLAFKVRGILLHHGKAHAVFLPPQLLHRSVFHRQVALSLFADMTEALNLLDRQGIENLYLPPLLKSHSPWMRLYEGIDLPPHHTKYLVRSQDFSEAYFCDDARQLADALWCLLSVPMEAERLAAEYLEHGEPGYEEVYRVATLLLDSLQEPFTTGAYVRVKSGVRAATHDYPEVTRLLAQHLTQEFPGDAFLTIQLQRNRCMDPHKDVRNSALPTLLCNLSPDAPGGTSVPMMCPDGVNRLGRIIAGKRYRLSARLLWHASTTDGRDRTLLLGWVPAGWQNLSHEDMASLRILGLAVPNNDDEAKGHLSLWRGAAEIQKGLADYGFVARHATRRQWPAGALKSSTQTVHVCLSSSDEEDDVLFIPQPCNP
ncbi:pol, partial [Symbiodinium necroappetens]